MEQTTILNNTDNIYRVSYDFDNLLNVGDLNNKLFLTFTVSDKIDEVVSRLSTKYSIMHNKMFVLHVKSNDEYVVTYNVDNGNVTDIPENTILVHRKKKQIHYIQLML